MTKYIYRYIHTAQEFQMTYNVLSGTLSLYTTTYTLSTIVSLIFSDESHWFLLP